MSGLTASPGPPGPVPSGPETTLQQAETQAVTALEVAARATFAPGAVAAVDTVFLAHFNSLPIACEAAMRPIIEAARKDLKAALAAL